MAPDSGIRQKTNMTIKIRIITCTCLLAFLATPQAFAITSTITFSPELQSFVAIATQESDSFAGNFRAGVRINFTAQYLLPQVPASAFNLTEVQIASSASNFTYAYRDADNGQFDLGGTLSASLFDSSFSTPLISDPLFNESESRLLGPTEPTLPPSTFRSGGFLFPLEGTYQANSEDLALFIGEQESDDFVGLEISGTVFARNTGALAFTSFSSGAFARTVFGGVSISFTAESLGDDPLGELVPLDFPQQQFDEAIQDSGGINPSIPPTETPPAGIFPPGDFNLDFTVDENDYLFFVSEFGATDSNADANGDGLVDAADYTVWRDHLGESIPSAQSLSTTLSTAVPEPTSSVLVICLIGYHACIRGWHGLSARSDPA